MLITEVVDAITSAKEAGHEALTFVVPITQEALHRSGLASATIEDRVQQAIINELKACLGEDHLQRAPEEAYLPLVPLSEPEVTDIILALRRSLGSRQMLSTSERRRSALIDRLSKGQAERMSKVGL